MSVRYRSRATLRGLQSWPAGVGGVRHRPGTGPGPTDRRSPRRTGCRPAAGAERPLFCYQLTGGSTAVHGNLMTSTRILIVEDEANIRRFVGIALQDEGFQVFEADSVKRALSHAASRQPDLVIVDLGLPDGDGKQLISELRGWLAVPILVLSARDREEEKVAALDAGADDYLTKPFGVPELLARIRAQLRRHGQTGTVAATSKVAFGEIEVDLATHEVWRLGEPVHLTP